MKPAMTIIFGINLNFSQLREESTWAGVSQGTRGERGEARAGDYEENKCNMDKSCINRIIGSWISIHHLHK